MESNLPLAKKLNVAAWIISVVVLGIVVMMRRIHIEIGIDFGFLPPFYSALNAVAALALCAALVFVKKKNITAHQRSIYVAMACSVLFLLSYVVYHCTTPHTEFGGQGGIRTAYFILLISHIALAAGTFPFILFTFIRGFTGQIDKHRKMARWVFPLWLYVAVTGPVIYLMIRPYY